MEKEIIDIAPWDEDEKSMSYWGKPWLFDDELAEYMLSEREHAWR